MHIFLALPYYLSWHYTEALTDMRRIWKNFFVFIFNFFSISLLLKTLFSPWHKMQESYGKVEDLFGNIIVNTMMRLVGGMVRLIFIIMGVFSLAVCAVVGLIALVFWLTLPFVLIYTFLQGINLLTK